MPSPSVSSAAAWTPCTAAVLASACAVLLEDSAAHTLGWSPPNVQTPKAAKMPAVMAACRKLFLSFLMQINPPTFVKNNAAFSTSPFGESAASVFLQNSLLRFSGRKY